MLVILAKLHSPWSETDEQCVSTVIHVNSNLYLPSADFVLSELTYTTVSCTLLVCKGCNLFTNGFQTDD